MVYKIRKPRKLMGMRYSWLLVLPKFWVEKNHLHEGYVQMTILDDESILIKPF